MIEIFQAHPWVLIVLGAFLIPISGMILGGIAAWLESREKRAALDALQTYASQGRDPPPELLRAINGGKRWKHDRDWYAHAEMRGADGAGEGVDVREEVRNATREARDEIRAGVRRWRRNEPLRTWRRAFTWAFLAGGAYVASRLVEMEDTQRGFLIAAVILGAIAAATFISALLTTIFREK